MSYWSWCVSIYIYLMISVSNNHFTNNTIFAGYNFINHVILAAVTKHPILFQEKYNISNFYVMICRKPFRVIHEFWYMRYQPGFELWIENLSILVQNCIKITRFLFIYFIYWIFIQALYTIYPLSVNSPINKYIHIYTLQ